MFNDLTRWCKDIGQYATDRPINDISDEITKEVLVEGSCIHRSSYCDKTCFNIKLYKLYPNMLKRDIRIEKAWQALTPENIHENIANFFQRKRKQIKRIRFNTRGESLKDIADIYRVKAMCTAMPDTEWWLPTRAWSDPIMKVLIEQELMPVSNLALNASTDPSTTQEEWEILNRDGWNIMFYGDDELNHDPATGEYMFQCPKTKKGMKGHCEICKGGCFSQVTTGKRRTVKLYQH